MKIEKAGSQGKFTVGAMVTLMAVSLMLGACVPSFYEWTGANQSRPSPWFDYVAIGMLATVVLVSVSLIWIPIGWQRPERKTKFSRIGLRTALIATGVLSVVFAGFAKSPTVTGIAIYVVALIYAIWTAIKFPVYRLPIITLFCCLYLPFTWILFGKGHLEWFEVLFRLLGWMPGLLPSMFICVLVDQRIHDANWLPTVVTTTEILVGLWMILLGAKRGIVCLMVIMVLSVFSSSLLDAMIRI